MTDQDNGKAGAITPTFLTEKVRLDVPIFVMRTTLQEMLKEKEADSLGSNNTGIEKT